MSVSIELKNRPKLEEAQAKSSVTGEDVKRETVQVSDPRGSHLTFRHYLSWKRSFGQRRVHYRTGGKVIMNVQAAHSEGTVDRSCKVLRPAAS